MTAFLLGLRLGRWGMVGFSLAAVVLPFIQAIGFYQVAGSTPPERAAFGATVEGLASAFVALFPSPFRPDTVEGYLQFRAFSPLTILFAIWALASSTGFARGDEERGVIEAELATGVSRVWLIVSRAAAFVVATILASAAAGAGALLGATTGGESIAANGLIEACALLAAMSISCYGICLLAAQFVAGRSATAVGGAILLALFFDNSLSRVFSGLAAWRWISPFRYYDLSQPLPPGGYLDVRSLIIPLGIGLIAGGLAAIAFIRRDVGAAVVVVPPLRQRQSLVPSSVPFWTLPVARGLYERRLGILAWCAGMAVIAAVFVALTKTIVQVLLNVPRLLPYLTLFLHRQLYPAVLGYTWFEVAQLMFAALAITYVARWVAEDTDGRLEAFLSAPISRAGIVMERMTVLAGVALVIAATSGAVLSFASHANGIDLDTERLVAAGLMLVPFALVFAAAGSLLAAWNPRAAVALLGAFAFATYLDNQLASIFKLPMWLQDLSPFKVIGSPLLNGIDNRSLALLVLLALAGVGSSILAMQRRDVGA